MTETMVVSEEVAREHLQSFLDFYELEAELITDSMKEGYDNALDRIIVAIKKGRLEIKEEDGLTLIQHLKKAPGEVKTITYGVLKGHAKVAMKGRSEKDFSGRMYALLGSLSGLGELAIMALEGPDLSLAECIGLVFLQV